MVVRVSGILGVVLQHVFSISMSIKSVDSRRGSTFDCILRLRTRHSDMYLAGNQEHPKDHVPKQLDGNPPSASMSQPLAT